MIREPYTAAVEFCVGCGRKIPEPEWHEPSNRAIVKHLYCSRSCAQRQQVTLKRLRDTTPQETETHDEHAYDEPEPIEAPHALQPTP